jgi:hypothetical protein
MTINQSTVKLWTRHEDAELERMYGLGLADSDIGRVLGRTTSAVLYRRSRIGLVQNKKERGAGVRTPRPEVTHLAIAGGVRGIRTGRLWRVRYGECPIAKADMHGPPIGMKPASLEARATSAAWGAR